MRSCTLLSIIRWVLKHLTPPIMMNTKQLITKISHSYSSSSSFSFVWFMFSSLPFFDIIFLSHLPLKYKSMWKKYWTQHHEDFTFFESLKILTTFDLHELIVAQSSIFAHVIVAVKKSIFVNTLFALMLVFSMRCVFLSFVVRLLVLHRSLSVIKCKKKNILTIAYNYCLFISGSSFLFPFMMCLKFQFLLLVLLIHFSRLSYSSSHHRHRCREHKTTQSGVWVLKGMNVWEERIKTIIMLSCHTYYIYISFSKVKLVIFVVNFSSETFYFTFPHSALWDVMG
jgi:hypothetical protein